MARPMPSFRSPNVFNLHVSINYVKSWTKWHALREFYQNLQDACLILLNYDTANLDVFKDAYSITFSNLAQRTAIAFVQYDPTTQKLVLSNELGSMSLTTKCLILGGSDVDKHAAEANTQLAGHFGEGFKLACLALLREQCAVSVIVRNNKWRFFLQPDPLFENEVCLHVEILNNTQQATVFEVTITGITSADFTFARRRLLPLTDIDPQYQQATKEGVVLLAPEFANQLFVKGIFVAEKPCGLSLSVGFDLYNLKLDRDRMAVLDASVFLAQASKMFAQTLTFYATDSAWVNSNRAQSLVDRVYSSIDHMSGISQHLKQPAIIDLFWNKFVALYPSKMPSTANYGDEGNIASSFRNMYVTVSGELGVILEKHRNHKRPKYWYTEFILSRQEHVLSEPEQSELRAAVLWVQGMPDLRITNIKVLANVTQSSLPCVIRGCLYIFKAAIDLEMQMLTRAGLVAQSQLSKGIQSIAARDTYMRL